MPPRVCQARKANGEPCRGLAHGDSPYCAFHCPELARKRQAGRRRGGASSRKPVVLADAGDVRISGMGDVVELLAQTVSQVRRGELDHRIANCLGNLASVLVRALQAGQLEERLAAIEGALALPGKTP